jgi:ankyrin repeat protein
MLKEANFPYPTFFESIRFIARTLDLKQSNKLLDDKAFERIFDPRELQVAIEKYLFLPIEKYLGPNAKDIIKKRLNESLKSYASDVMSIPADGISRLEMLPLLQNSFIRYHIVKVITDIHFFFGGPDPATLFSPDTLSVTTTLNWLEQHEMGWTEHLRTLEKDRQDRISSWIRGDNIPSSQSIYLLQNNAKEPYIDQINWQRVRTLLFTARAIDFLRREHKLKNLLDETRLFLWGTKNTFSLVREIETLQSKLLENISDVLPILAKLQNGLMRTVTKNNADEFKEHLDLLRNRLKDSKEECSIQQYWLDWYEARWQTFSGNLESANQLYKTAFEDSLFRSGENQKAILFEAIVVAASLENPDKVFLKHLKWTLINFNYDIPSVNAQKPSKNFSDSVEDWEIQLWKSNFDSMFPKEGLFPGTKFEDKDIRKGLLPIDESKLPKPDYRYPDRKIKVGETWKKTMPQLVWFVLIENIEIVEMLIKKGANVNVTSDSDDTPIILALQALNVTDVPYQSLDDSFFWLISNQKHSKEIINKRTQKKRLLPIISAVETGRADIVTTVLNFGADPNGRGKTDEQTALNVCLKLLALIKDPNKFWKNQEVSPITPEVLDSIRRHCSGSSGFTLEQQLYYLANNYNDPFFKNFKPIYIELMTKQIIKYMNLNSLREIASILIEAGANVDAEHASPIRGYTPLMLAAEIDESDIFNHMLVKGGDPAKFYIDPRTNEKVNCWDISKYFGSKNVQRCLHFIT